MRRLSDTAMVAAHQGAFRMYPNGYKPREWQVLSRNKAYRNRAHCGVFIHRCINLIFEDGLYADNEIDVDIDRADAIVIKNFTIIGESESFKQLKARQPRQDVCSRRDNLKIGLDVHSWKRDFVGNAEVMDVRFENFHNVQCSETHAIDMDPTVSAIRAGVAV